MGGCRSWIKSNHMRFKISCELNEFVKKQNVHYWSANNPNWKITKSLHPKLVTVWCAISQYHIIGPFFMTKTDTVNVNSVQDEEMFKTIFFFFFFGIEDMSSCPKTNLVSMG